MFIFLYQLIFIFQHVIIFSILQNIGVIYMGRPGAGGGGGSRSFSSHSSSRSVSSHRSSFSSSRSSSSGSGVGRFSSGSSYRAPRAPIGTRTRWRGAPYYYGGVYGGGGYRRGGSGIGWIAIVIILIVIFAMSYGGSSSSRSSGAVPASTINRTKLTNSVSFTKDCVKDDLGWFNSKKSVGSGLKAFYDKTGVQPYVYLVGYSPDLKTDSDKEQWASGWYDNNIHNEDTFAFFYFAERDADNDMGLMTQVSGKRIVGIMDSEAVEIFFANMDKYWYGDDSMDDVVIKAFKDTGNQIMKKTTTKEDVAKTRIIGIIGVVVIGGIIVIMILRRKHQKAQNEETERILNTPLDTSSSKDELADKYSE